MIGTAYLYTVKQCDVVESARKKVAAYRVFRDSCLDMIRSDSDTSIANQVHDLAWHTAVFRTLNEARRIDEKRDVTARCASSL